MDAQGATHHSLAPAADPLLAGSAAVGALLFPGQGSQTPTMRELVDEERPDLLELAVDEMGDDPFELIDEGTAYAQPALYAASIAAWERAGRPQAAAVAGHSLGELAALVAAGSVDSSVGLTVAIERGRLMQEAAEEAPPGGMLAVLGDEPKATEMAREFGLTVANHNSVGQLVLSGPVEQLDAAKAVARDRKIKAMKLPVAGAFHSPAMEAAVAPFREFLDDVDFATPQMTVYSCITAGPLQDIRATLADALVKPVRWTETLAALHAAGVQRFTEIGPGKVLTGLVRRTLPDVEAVALETANG